MKFFLIFLTLVTYNYAWKPCYPETCWGKKHTLCEYDPCVKGEQCNKVFVSLVTDEERREIVQTHNRLRAKVANGQETRGNPGPQPRGRIGPLTWDRRLALAAQTWANQCIFGHDTCRDVKRFQVGQNVGYTGNVTETYDKLTVLIENWYDEVQDFSRYHVKNFNPTPGGPTITHYSQLIWGNTTRIGCGLVRHYTFGEMYRTHLVCNYGAKGNWIGEHVYETF
ncbi:venom allergen 5-like [Microplitis mediator]|uniref:venom allergen 5-like n=1 Tax=Microplitis mediator TaxID=375433 RepID=UPI00255613BD|nr:venom allergen 5-like [Microplitis mediator]